MNIHMLILVSSSVDVLIEGWNPKLCYLMLHPFCTQMPCTKGRQCIWEARVLTTGLIERPGLKICSLWAGCFKTSSAHGHCVMDNLYYLPLLLILYGSATDIGTLTSLYSYNPFMRLRLWARLFAYFLFGTQFSRSIQPGSVRKTYILDVGSGRHILMANNLWL